MTQITLTVDSGYALDLLMQRLEYWNPDDTERELYYQMYDNHLNSGALSSDFDPICIVDNDWVNYCTIVTEDDKDFPQLLKAWEDDEHDVSCDTFPSGSRYGYIEAYANGAFLVRYR